jgi:hypothetical protein
MSTLRRFARPLSVLALFAGLASAASAATVVNYADLKPLADRSLVTTHGTTAEVAITTRSFLNDAGKTTSANNVLFWNEGYSDLPAAVYANSDGRGGEVTLTPIAGFTVTLQSFQLGSWLGGPNLVIPLLRVIEVGTGNVLWNGAEPNGFLVNTTKTLMPDVSSAAGLALQWGYDFNVGLGNFTFDAVRTGSISVVPVPPAVALFLGGLGLLCFAGRKRS